MSKQPTLPEILDKYFAPIKLPDNNRKELVSAIEAALNRQALATALRLIGEPEPGMQSKVTKTPIGLQIDEWGDIGSGFRNELRQELRRAFRKEYGISDE